jgi:hypothetical protein
MSKLKKLKISGSFDRPKGRATALKVVKQLRGILKQMAADPTVCEFSVNQLRYATNSLEELISHVLPSPESISNATLDALFEEEWADFLQPSERLGLDDYRFAFPARPFTYLRVLVSAAFPILSLSNRWAVRFLAAAVDAFLARAERSSGVIVSSDLFPPIFPPFRPICLITSEISFLFIAPLS